MSDECLMKQEMVISFYVVYQAVMRKFTLAGKSAASSYTAKSFRQNTSLRHSLSLQPREAAQHTAATGYATSTESEE